jgi:hypothetical protein
LVGVNFAAKAKAKAGEIAFMSSEQQKKTFVKVVF